MLQSWVLVPQDISGSGLGLPVDSGLRLGLGSWGPTWGPIQEGRTRILEGPDGECVRLLPRWQRVAVIVQAHKM